MAKIVIAGVVRNVEKVIRSELVKLTTCFENHDLVKIVVIESDSTDNTIEELEATKKSLEVLEFESLGSMSAKFRKRAERISQCRNKYLEALEQNKFYDADYLYVSDLDGVNENLTTDTIDRVVDFLSKNPGASATANQKYKYYDIWALRHPVWNSSDCWFDYHRLKDILGKDQAHQITNLSKMIHIDESLDPIEVDSAFGGGAFYDINFLQNCRYEGESENREICEHIYFSKKYKLNGGRIYIFPSFINHSTSVHVLNAEKFSETLSSPSMVEFGEES